jgi:putative ABC transport system ATP-binding protein
MKEKIVTCNKLCKTFGEKESSVKALKGVDLEVNAGELLMLVGPSGSGKTTLISIIAGILTQTSGQCHILEQDINHLPENEKTSFRGSNIGFVFQSFNLIPMFSVLENVIVPLLLNGYSNESAQLTAKELIINLGLQEKIHAYPLELSGGQQQRVAIARGIVHSPRLIVCDEPTSSLDIDTGKKVLTLFREHFLKEDRSLIIVTHDARILDFADRIVKLEDGVLV